MQSNGGLTDAASFRGKDSILSGPAGGIVGMARTARDAGFGQVIGFDMGGTSTDVSHFAGEFEREYETQVAGVRMRAPMLSIHTVAAGGGSVLHFDGSRYRVGPDSAGADPGPACYRRGGPLTVTDANVLLGRIQPGHFPQRLRRARRPAARRGDPRAAFAELSDQIAAATGDTRGPEQVAAGFLEIAVANMANAIKKISVQRGYDVTGYVLNVFGGAGGQHACAVADALGMTTVLIHPLAGVLSAYGIGLADIIAMREQAVEAPLTAGLAARLPGLAAPLEADARAEILAEGVPAERITAAHRAHLRYEGTDTAVIVPVGSLEEMTAAFEAEYSRRFSFLMPDKPVIAEAVSVEVTGAADEPVAGADSTARSELEDKTPPVEKGGTAGPAAQVPMFAAGAWAQVDLFARAGLRPGHAIDGPAIITEELATTVVEPGWQAVVSDRGDLLLSRVVARPGQADVGTTADPVLLEIFNNLFMSVAEQMGVRLQATAHSVNIKERLEVIRRAGQIAASEASVLIGGESGTGKEVLARHIHRRSRRAGGPFIALNCAAIPDTLLESELFGHEKGAFSGALARRVGKFEAADGGTLLLEEVSEMDVRLQAKLLRALQEREIDRLGGSAPVRINVRILATTNRDLPAEVARGAFREDLYFRLNVVAMQMPPLRERTGDILPLADYFGRRYSELNGVPNRALTADAAAKLLAHSWRGNVRELENAMHRAVLLADGGVIGPEAIELAGAAAPRTQASQPAAEPAVVAASGDVSGLVGRRVEEVERELILHTLTHTFGNRTHAAVILGISIRALRNKLRDYAAQGLAVPRPTAGIAA